MVKPVDGLLVLNPWERSPLLPSSLPFAKCGRLGQCLVELVEGEAVACGLELGERGYPRMKYQTISH